MNTLYQQTIKVLKDLWTKYRNIIIGIIGLIILIFFLIYFIDARDKTYLVEKTKRDIEFKEYQNKYTKAQQLITKQQTTIDSLTNIKQQILIKYEKVINDFGNPYIISNDSITRYIASKIHNSK